MYTTTTIIHYNRHLVLRKEFGKYKWRGKEFDTEEQAFNAIDDKITHFKNKNMEQNKFEWTDALVAEYSLKEQKMTLYEFKRFIAEREASKTKPKEYEILSFVHNLFGVGAPQIIKRNDDGTFGEYSIEENFFLNIPTHKIDSVRRLSDNKVFSIGDEVEWGSGLLGYGKMQYNVKKIERFGIDENDNLKVYFNGIEFLFLSQIKKAKQLILTTQDGKDIYELDKCWYVGKEFEINEWVAFETEILHLDKLKYFSTKEAAESYIAWNKTQFSLAEIMANSHLLQEDGSMDCYAFSRIKLIELAKSKTK